MSTKHLDDYGAEYMRSYGANSAPLLAYEFPGWTCISLNNVVAHGIPSEQVIFKEGDLINIDVSGELNGFWSDIRKNLL
jgi:methionyl aminopeptidase